MNTAYIVYIFQQKHFATMEKSITFAPNRDKRDSIVYLKIKA